MKRSELIKGYALITMCMCALSTINAQDSTFKKEANSDVIVTDRPDQSESPFLTPRGYVQVESGSMSLNDEVSHTTPASQSITYNSTLFKYGLKENFELRLIAEYAEMRFASMVPGSEGDSVSAMRGFCPVLVGSKIALQEEKGIIPKISLLTHLVLPYFGASCYRPQYIIPKFRFLFTHTLSDRVTFSYNLGAEWQDGTNAATGIYTASFGFALTDKLGMFAEAFGYAKERGGVDNHVDSGFTYLFTNNLQVDLSGGMSLGDEEKEYFISGGLSFRFNALKKSTKKVTMKQKQASLHG